MEAINIARRLAELGQTGDAQNAYCTAIHQNDGADPGVDFEAALFLLQTEYDYKVPYTVFLRLYNAGHFQGELLDIMTGAFYAPNLTPQRRRYEKNRAALRRYPYLFRRDFPDFDQLPVKFFPFDDDGYLPFDARENTFGDYMAPSHPVVGRNFFANLDQPVLASDVFSQYELEYLNDNVRKSEWCAKENHIYLHYANWVEFCSWLSVLDLRELLKERKFVFLMEEEKALYPLDFQERFGIDYSQYQVRPFSIREINRLIWHTQLSFHNGGDFFNEVFHGHPNLLIDDSILMSLVQAGIRNIRKDLGEVGSNPEAIRQMAEFRKLAYPVCQELATLQNPSDKDILVACFLGNHACSRYADPACRITPALFFQPHFEDFRYTMTLQNDRCELNCPEYQAMYDSGLLQSFPYIKTFTPMRRPTTSYAATNRFAYQMAKTVPVNPRDDVIVVARDHLADVLTNRSYMPDWQDRLFMDSRIVRFEDGKLNPRATFTALAAFLDLPYTESMTRCTTADGENPIHSNNVRGFDPANVFRTYDAWTSDGERYLLEFFLQDVYREYGYDILYYDGKPVDENRVERMIDSLDRWKKTIFETFRDAYVKKIMVMAADGQKVDLAEIKTKAESVAESNLQASQEYLKSVVRSLLPGLRFVNKNGQPLRFMELLRPDPALLERELYH